MMAHPVVSPEVLRAAISTYELELALAPDSLHADALARAIAAGIRAHEQAVLRKIADQADTYAREIEADTDIQAAETLAWFADKIRTGLDEQPPGTYRPQAGDVVEVTIIGQVSTYHHLCSGCGHVNDDPDSFSVLDDYTGIQFNFDLDQGQPQIRVLARASDQDD